MSLENEDQGASKASEKFEVVPTKPKIMYPRELLMSLSKLDICKNLPRGFDESLLSEFEDTSQSIPDCPRIPGSLPLQGFRRNEYGSSPPTRGDSGNYSRGNYGRWESRSSGRSDRDSDSQSDMDSDSGRRYSNQSRRSWQAPEHDGLLGSGSFPRPSGSAAGFSASKARAANENNQSKSSELYHPPRPYKAIPHLRKDTDAYNDETFGSTECTSEDRAEEERRRRASFETMRKEQQKFLQDKQKVIIEKHKAGSVSVLSEVLEDSKEDKDNFVNNKLEVSTAIPISSNDLEKCSFASHSPASRPLVPPGFRNNTLEKSFGSTPLIHPFLSEVGKHATGESPLYAGDNHIQDGIADDLEQQLSQEISLVDRQPADKTKHELLMNKGQSVNFDLSLDIPTAKLGGEDQFPHISSHMDPHGTRADPEIFELNAKVLEDKTTNDSEGNHSTSILEKNFGSKLSMSAGDCGLAQHHESKLDDTWSPDSVQSSRFARWFSEEEAKPTDDTSSGRPKDLLSFLVSGDKGRNQGSDVEVTGRFPRDFSYGTLEYSNKLTLDVPSAANGLSELVCVGDKKEVVSTVLTCEDLEQLMLSEYSSKTSNAHPLLKSWSANGSNIEKPSVHVDDHASQHLLSLLQKGIDQSNVTLNSGIDIVEDKLLVPQESDTGNAVKGYKGKDDTNNIPSSGNTLTLETLFGTAFMKELQSVGAPVSIQSGSIGSAQIDAPEPHELSFPVTQKIELQRPNHDTSVLNSNHRQQTKLSLSENWLGFDNSQIERTSSRHHSEAFPKHGVFDGLPEFQLPEEGNLISWTGNSSKNAPIDIKEKLAAISALVKDEHVMVDSNNLPFTRDPFEQMESEIPYHNLQVQQSSPQFQSLQMTQGRPLFHPMDSHPAHMSSETKFLGPEAIFNHDSRASLQFPSHMIRLPFRQPNARVAGFDVPSHHPLLRQIQTPGNQPSRMLPEFPRGGPDSYHGNQIPGFIQEMNPVARFPFGPHQANIGSHGVQIPAPIINSGGNPPEAFQRLIEMEFRGNSKQIHPFTPGHNEGVYNHEVDMGFQYR